MKVELKLKKVSCPYCGKSFLVAERAELLYCGKCANGKRMFSSVSSNRISKMGGL